MRLSLRDRDGREIDAATAPDGKQAVFEAMMLLVRLDRLDVGDTLSVAAADDAPPTAPA